MDNYKAWSTAKNLKICPSQLRAERKAVPDWSAICKMDTACIFLCVCWYAIAMLPINYMTVSQRLRGYNCKHHPITCLKMSHAYSEIGWSSFSSSYSNWGVSHYSYSYFVSDEFWWMLIVWRYCLDEFWLFGHSLEVSVTLRGVNAAVHSWGGSIGVPRRGSSWTCLYMLQ